MLISPVLSSDADHELAASVEEAIRSGGGTIGQPDAPDLSVRAKQYTLSWISKTGSGITATAQVVLVAEIRYPDGHGAVVRGEGIATKHSSGIMWHTTAQPMMTQATTDAINELLSSNLPQLEKPPSSVSAGSGFFISASGHVATAAHVVEGKKTIYVFVGKKKMQAEVIALSQAIDLAILKVDMKPEGWLPIADKSAVGMGDDVFTIGFPVAELLGATQVYSKGVVNALSGLGGDESFLQMSVPLQPGNSGGPLVLIDGRVIGVITSTAAIGAFLKTTGTLPQNVNWAVQGHLLGTMSGWQSPKNTPPPAETKREALLRVKGSVVRVVSK